MRQFIVLVLAISLMVACTTKPKTENGNQNYEVKYAKGFTVDKQADYTLITVRNPWDTAKVLQRYVLVDKDVQLPANLPQGKLVRTPLSKVAVSSTIHCSSLDELGFLNAVKGVCEPEYIALAKIKEGVATGAIVNLGQASNANIEQTMLLSPEVFFTSPIEGMTYGGLEKTGITLVETPDYMESDPLGRAEWLRFYSLFVGQEALADSLFNVTAKNYQEIKNLVSTVENKPTVLLDTKYGNTWYVAGGQSYMANMMKDAGASYIWADNQTTGSLPMSFEQVLSKGEKAEYWLIKYDGGDRELTYNGLKNEYSLYEHFSAFKNKNIYQCNTVKRTYYEDLPIHPDWILKEFAFIFHPDLFEGYSPKYYFKMTE